MKMVMAVVPKEEANAVINELVAAGHTATFMESRGGALRQARQALFIAIEDQDLDKVLDIISRYCHSCVSLEREGSAGGPPAFTRETAEVGGAVAFVWELESFHKY